MDLTAIAGLGPARRTKLEDAGVKTIEQLAEADVAELAARSGVAATLVTDFQGQARELQGLLRYKGLTEPALILLADAGVRSAADLAKADVDRVAADTGIEAKQLGEWQLQAKARTTAREVGAIGKRAAGELAHARVVLREGIQDARIMVENRLVSEAKILPVRAKDNVDRMLENIKGNVVVLREKADTALVRVEDTVHEGIPIFKERLEKAGAEITEEAREVRVRVQEVRDKRVLPQAERLRAKVGRVFRRGDREA